MTDTAPDPTVAPVASQMPVAPAPADAAPVTPKPEIEYHEQTGTVMLHYYEPGLDAPDVTRLARATGADVIGAPDDLGFGADEPHWRIQVAATTPKEEA